MLSSQGLYYYAQLVASFLGQSFTGDVKKTHTHTLVLILELLSLPTG